MAKQRTTVRLQKDSNIRIVHIQSTFNNTIVSVTDDAGNTLSWSSSGKKDIEVQENQLLYAAQIVTKEVVQQAVDMYGLQSVGVHLKGPRAGRESAT